MQSAPPPDTPYNTEAFLFTDAPVLLISESFTSESRERNDKGNFGKLTLQPKLPTSYHALLDWMIPHFWANNKPWMVHVSVFAAFAC